jgi:hypothetical protein
LERHPTESPSFPVDPAPLTHPWALNRSIIGCRWEHTARHLGASVFVRRAQARPLEDLVGEWPSWLKIARLGHQREPAGAPARARWDFQVEGGLKGRLILPPELGPDFEGRAAAAKGPGPGAIAG